MATQLSVNLNKIALLRNARGRDYPSVIEFSRKVLETTAVGVTMHPRPDQRHARNSDVYELAELLIDNPGKELNIEGNPADEFMKLVLDIKPHQCTLVPDDPDQVTSDHGWDLHRDMDFVRSQVARLNDVGIRTSIFMDPVATDMELAAQTGTDRIELYTEQYAENYGHHDQDKILRLYRQTAETAQQQGMAVNAGHDLNLDNLELFLTGVSDVREVSIGHAITVESLEYGFTPTLKRYLEIIERVNENSIPIY